MLAKEREVQKIEDKAAEDLKIKQSLEAETQNVNKNSLLFYHQMTLHDIQQRSFKVISAEIIDLIKNKNDDSRPFRIKETEYDFVDPCPEEMKQVDMLHFFKTQMN